MDDGMHYIIDESSLGAVLVAHTVRGVSAILIDDDRDALLDDLRHRFPRATLVEGDAGSRALAARVIALIETPAHAFDAALDLAGTEFQRAVWSALRQIPPGSTTTYTEIAARIGRPSSVRAVASACAANPAAVAVPCHRVVRRDGGLAGYRWGMERKRVLLDRERDLLSA